jgi:hypothetical protein
MTVDQLRAMQLARKLPKLLSGTNERTDGTDMDRLRGGLALHRALSVFSRGGTEL